MCLAKVFIIADMFQVESAKSRGLRGNVGCVDQIFTWVAWVEIFCRFNLFYVGQNFLRESKFFAVLNFCMGHILGGGWV